MGVIVRQFANLGAALILLTAARSGYTAWRRRDAHSGDIFAVGLALSAALLPHSLLGGLQSFLYFVQPFFLLRLIQHFRRVSPIFVGVSAVGVVGASVAVIGSATPQAGHIFTGALLYAVALEIYAFGAFARESHQSSGVTRMRLVFAALACVLTAVLFAQMSLMSLEFEALQAKGRSLAGVIQAVNGCLGICYFLAFTPPRRLRARWQRTEQARFLAATADREPEERARMAAEELCLAATRSVGHSLVLVAQGNGDPAADLLVRASTDPQLRNVVITAGPAGLVRRACLSRTHVVGVPADCEPGLAGRLVGLGSSVQIAPIASTSHTWGVVLIVQKQGSLFPQDDGRLLEEFARYAATGLDHAHLIAESRMRERRLAERRIHEVESQMGLMLESIKDYAMFILDPQGRVVTWYSGAVELFGHSPTEMEDESGATLYTLSPAQFAALIEEARAKGFASHEGLCQRRDGARFMGATIVRPLEDGGGDSPGFVVVTHDVTRQRELEDQLRQSQKMEAVGQLAGGIAHDFNNLLTAISGYADYLELQLDGDDERLESVAQIQKAGARASGLTRQLLAFSRRRMLQPSAIHVPGLVADLLPMLRRVIGEHVEIVDDGAIDVPAVMGDRSQVEQIIVNLAVNARDAMPAGGRLILRSAHQWLDAHAAGELPPGGYVMLEVIDTGVGMDESVQSRIFEPFFTTKEFGAGTGLGLSTVYGIVKQMGGTVRVKSELGKGTTFRLYFPETLQRETPNRAATAAELPTGTETLLLVEDDEVVRTFLVNTLRRYGYVVIASGHPAGAVGLAQAHPDRIDLLITDVVLPGLTGPELVQAIEAVRPGLPALYISGYADAVLARQGTFPKASHFLQKPFTAAEFLTRIRQVLESR